MQISFFLPIIGIIVGAILQYYFNKRFEENKQMDLLKIEAYTDFIKAINAISISQKTNNKIKEFEYLILLADSKTRISVYGSDEVVNAISNLYRQGALLDNLESQKKMIEVIQQMRKETFTENKSSDNEISQLLFSQDLYS